MLTPQLRDSRFMKAARCEPTDVTPVWIMRQAGRYMPEYMAVRSKVTFLELCKRPDLAAEVTLSAQRVLGVDAAILFADLLPILEPMGFDLEYLPGEGPVIHNPLRAADDVDRVRAIDGISARCSSCSTRSSSSATSCRPTFRCWVSPVAPSRWRRMPSREAARRTTSRRSR